MSTRAKLSAEVLERLSKPELRAVAHDRGYKVGDGGKGTLITRILDAQKDDRLVGEDPTLIDPVGVTEELDQYTKDTPEETKSDGDGRQPSTLNPPSPVRENPLQSEPSSAPAPTLVPTNAPKGNPSPAQPASGTVGSSSHTPSSSPSPSPSNLVIKPSASPSASASASEPTPVKD